MAQQSRQMSLFGSCRRRTARRSRFVAASRSAHRFDVADYYRHIASVLERGRFDLGFFDDRLAMPDMYGGDHAHTVEHGIRCVKMDPVTVLMTMAMARSHLGLGATYSTTYYEPFHVARVFATVDLMTEGRAAWNVVTSLNDNEARNMGRVRHLGHEERYDQGDEFMEIVLGHWNSWDDDAVLYDKVNQRFADPSKVRRLDYEGEHYRSRGPFTVPRSRQGHPVVIPAGQSERGRAFAARWGERSSSASAPSSTAASSIGSSRTPRPRSAAIQTR